MIGAPHRFFIVLDDDERVPFLPQRALSVSSRRRLSRACRADRRLVEHIKHAAQIGAGAAAASRMRCDSPPLSVFAERPSAR